MAGWGTGWDTGAGVWRQGGGDVRGDQARVSNCAAPDPRAAAYRRKERRGRRQLTSDETNTIIERIAPKGDEKRKR